MTWNRYRQALTVQEIRKNKNDRKSHYMIIPQDRTVAVGPGAKDFVTELSVKVLHNARHDINNWKGVPDVAKNRIVAHMLYGLEMPEAVQVQVQDLKKEIDFLRAELERKGDKDDVEECHACGDYASRVFWTWCDTCKDTISCMCCSCNLGAECKSCKKECNDCGTRG